MPASPIKGEGDLLPPHCPEAERGVLGCCLLDMKKATVALRAGVNRRWFYDGRHAELFAVLARMASNCGLDPSRHKQSDGRPVVHTAETLLEVLGHERLTITEWENRASEEHGVSRSRFFTLLKALLAEEKVTKSPVDSKWEQIDASTKTHIPTMINNDGPNAGSPKSPKTSFGTSSPKSPETLIGFGTFGTSLPNGIESDPSCNARRSPRMCHARAEDSVPNNSRTNRQLLPYGAAVLANHERTERNLWTQNR